MKLNPNEKISLAVAGAFVLFWLFFICGAGYIAAHFIIKFW